MKGIEITPQGALAAFAARGLVVQANGDKLTVGPSDLLTPPDRDYIRANKPALLALLSEQAATPAAAPEPSPQPTPAPAAPEPEEMKVGLFARLWALDRFAYQFTG